MPAAQSANTMQSSPARHLARYCSSLRPENALPSSRLKIGSVCRRANEAPQLTRANTALATIISQRKSRLSCDAGQILRALVVADSAHKIPSTSAPMWTDLGPEAKATAKSNLRRDADANRSDCSSKSLARQTRPRSGLIRAISARLSPTGVLPKG